MGEAMAEPGVGCVDLRHFTGGSSTEREHFVRALDESLRGYGFVRVRGHGIDAGLIDEAYRLWASFFEGEAEAKAACGGVPGGQRGFTPFGVERARGYAVPDQKEFFHVGQRLEAGDPLEAVYPPNLWPARPPGLEVVSMKLYRALEEAAATLLRAVALAYGLAEERLASMIERGNSILRIAHYPPRAAGADPRALRAAPHEDINLITLLCEASGSGLELLPPAREGHARQWLPVCSEPGEIVADAGDMLARLSAGVIPATTHRVVGGEEMDGRARYSMPFFAHPRPECDLSVDPHFLAPGQTPPTPPITAQAFLEERLAEIGLVT